MTVTEFPLPTVDLAPYLLDPTSEASLKECKKVAEALTIYSALAVRDPRVSDTHNATFLDIMEDYFNQSTDVKMKDTRPDLMYQVGATPELTEVPRCGGDVGCQEMIEKMDKDNRPHDFSGADPKWRYFWNIGNRPDPAKTKFPSCNAAPVTPSAFPKWVETMDQWGNLMRDSVSIVAEMAAVGFGLPKDTLVELARDGPHLLAPTATDLMKWGKVGTTLAGFHYDLNFLTIHGKSRFPGLYIWPKTGPKILVKIPDGCLLVQAGIQMEHLTGGTVKAGYHEVVIVDSTLDAMTRQSSKSRPLWRISSTLFFHIASDNILKPLPPFSTPETRSMYPEILTGEQVQRELGIIALSK